MRPGKMSIHREGHGIIIITGLIAFLINVPLAIVTHSGILAVMVALISTVIIIAFVSFFRIPHRDFHIANNKIIAPQMARWS
jgi:putative effector of murein hydrolase